LGAEIRGNKREFWVYGGWRNGVRTRQDSGRSYHKSCTRGGSSDGGSRRAKKIFAHQGMKECHGGEAKKGGAMNKKKWLVDIGRRHDKPMHTITEGTRVSEEDSKASRSELGHFRV